MQRSFYRHHLITAVAIVACLGLLWPNFTLSAENKRKPTQLPKAIQSLLRQYKVPAKNISVFIKDLDTEQVLLTHNADVLRSPASTMKLLATYAGLKALGPNYSWRTEAWIRGTLTDGILTGDLILKGYGDPFLVQENFWKFIKTLRTKGLKEIHGNLIIDNSYFELPSHNRAAFDKKPFRVYNAPSSALMFNFQATQFLLQGNENNNSIDITPYPSIDAFKLINKIKRVNGKCRRSYLRPTFSKDNRGHVVIKGKYSPTCKQRFVLRAISNPEEHVFNAFKQHWKDLNGLLTGSYTIGRVTPTDELFHTYSSPTLGEQIRLINKWSNNVMAKQLLLTLGANKLGAPGTPNKGRQAILTTLDENNIGTQGIVIDNGSGLSRQARITAKQMANLLSHAYHDPLMPEFLASLSILGVDGTLINRFKNQTLQGSGHFKTGTLDNVTAIAGYMLNQKGKHLVIVIQHNGKRASGKSGREIQNALLSWSFEQ